MYNKHYMRRKRSKNLDFVFIIMVGCVHYYCYDDAAVVAAAASIHRLLHIFFLSSSIIWVKMISL